MRFRKNNTEPNAEPESREQLQSQLDEVNAKLKKLEVDREEVKRMRDANQISDQEEFYALDKAEHIRQALIEVSREILARLDNASAAMAKIALRNNPPRE